MRSSRIVDSENFGGTDLRRLSIRETLIDTVRDVRGTHTNGGAIANPQWSLGDFDLSFRGAKFNMFLLYLEGRF